MSNVADQGACALPVTWMPAHTAVHDIKTLYKSDGKKLSKVDRDTNALADKNAKAAAEGRRVQRWIRQHIEARAEEVTEMAKWLAEVTIMANRFPLQDGAFVRDSSACRRTRVRKPATRKAEELEPATLIERGCLKHLALLL